MDPQEFRAMAEVLLGPAELTRIDAAREAGIDVEQARLLWRESGFPPVPDDVPLFTPVDVVILRIVRELLARPGVDVALILQLTRVTGQSMTRLADAQVGASQSGLNPKNPHIVDDLKVLVPELERLIGFVWRRHLLAALLRRAATPVEGTQPLTIGFADMVGFTVLSQALDSAELAAMVDRFETSAYAHIPEHGGRIIKLIGDEVMFAADDPAAGAQIALELVDAHRDADDLPEVRVGLAHGPVVPWAGDLYGPTVNLANRLVNIARPSSALVSDELGRLLQDHPGLLLRHLRPVPLQGIGRVRSWVLRRAA